MQALKNTNMPAVRKQAKLIHCRLPRPAPISGTVPKITQRQNARISAKLPSSGIIADSLHCRYGHITCTLCRVQCGFHLYGHIVFVVFGQHTARLEDTIAHDSVGDHTLPLAKQVWQNSVITHGKLVAVVCRDELHMQRVLVLNHRAFLYHRSEEHTSEL